MCTSNFSLHYNPRKEPSKKQIAEQRLEQLRRYEWFTKVDCPSIAMTLFDYVNEVVTARLQLENASEYSASIPLFRLDWGCAITSDAVAVCPDSVFLWEGADRGYCVKVEYMHEIGTQGKLYVVHEADSDARTLITERGDDQ